jgi:hypothetical protein
LTWVLWNKRIIFRLFDENKLQNLHYFHQDNM